METDSVSLCNNCILGKHHDHHPKCQAAMGQESDELGAGANCFCSSAEVAEEEYWQLLSV
jgi:hypothetical protein